MRVCMLMGMTAISRCVGVDEVPGAVRALGTLGAPDYRWVRLDTGSWYMAAQAVCLVEDGRVSLSLSVRHRRPRPVGALVMTLVAGPHQRAVPVMLHQAVDLATPAAAA